MGKIMLIHCSSLAKMSSTEKCQADGEPARYVFKNPFATSIHRLFANSDESLSLLQEINTHQPPSRQLPVELLLQINKELHRTNPVLEEIRAAWKPITRRDANYSTSLGLWQASSAKLDLDTKRYKYHVPEERDSYDNLSIRKLYRHISSADLLYRLRCFFPEIHFGLGPAKLVWAAALEHRQVGISLWFLDVRARPKILYGYVDDDTIDNTEDFNSQKSLKEDFYVDLLRLLNAFFETVDGSQRLAYYHPVADADISPDDDESFVAVPNEIYREPIEEKENRFSAEWSIHGCTEKSSLVLESVFSSFLQDLKYNVKTRKIDRVNGTANLTTVISSSLLFYRLLCQPTFHKSEPSVNQLPAITSVWQVQCTHRPTGISIYFMDDHGLFDIRAGEDAVKVMAEIELLVEFLCSDDCTHPYGGTLAGCALNAMDDEYS